MDQLKIQRLYAAIENANIDDVRTLLDSDQALIRVRPYMGNSWLHIAARDSTIPIVDELLARGLDIDCQREGGDEPPLHFAVTRGALNVAEHLLNRGSDPNLSRMLISAINRDADSFEFVKVLVKHGVDVNLCWRFDEDDPTSPLFNALSWAIDAEKHDIAEYLRQHGATMPPAEAPSPSKSAAEQIIAYFEQRIGAAKPQALRRVVPGKVPLAIHLIPASKERNYLTLFTTGMSEEAMSVPEGGEEFQYAELVMFLPRNWPLDSKALQNREQRWPVEWLIKIADYPHENQTWLGGPVTVLANDSPPKPLAPGCPFSAMLLAAGYGDLDAIHLHDGRLVHFYTLLPLYREEYELERRKGLPELFNRFDRHGVDRVVDVKRRNVAG